MNMEKITLITKASKDYELLDSGFEEKLERYGTYVLARPDPQALWKKHLPSEVWADADAAYAREGREGQWKTKKTLPREWEITINGLTMRVKPTSFKHTGIFPEQTPN